jgi:acyl-homoserine-lactone acylase
MKEKRAVHDVRFSSGARFLSLYVLSALLLAAQPAAVYARNEVSPATIDPAALARSVIIHRDRYGVPHIEGSTDVSVIFGFAYCQAEDYLWQIEESYVAGLGRASELHGEESYQADWNNRLFEVPRSAQEDFEKLDAKSRAMCAAFAAGLNFYLEKHAEVKLRLLERFEPWHVLAFGRNVLLQTIYHPPSDRSGSSAWNESSDSEADLIGSNAYAIGPSRTRNGSTMLYANPHQPYYGYGQFYEGHLRSAEGLNFSGATFFGSPLPSIGHNEHLGWTCTVNQPNTGNAWQETFDELGNPLNYKYGDGYRTASEWLDTIKVKTASGYSERKVTFRKTHHGPIALTINGQKQIAVNIGKFGEAFFSRQSLQMLKAQNLSEFLAAMEPLEQHLYNVVYADRDGNILYLYNGIVPRRDPAFDWEKPLDGANPRTEWKGYHTLGELPRVLNPVSGFVQNCNQTPFTTTDDGNPLPGNFPAYMIQKKEQNDDKRRAKMARYLLRNLHGVTFEKWQAVCLDTTIYWAITELPKYKEEFAKLKRTEPELAVEVEPYLTHLLNWDGRGGKTSTQATLCLQWYEELTGPGYATRENLRPEFLNNPQAQFKALLRAAAKLKMVYGDWKVAWGEVHRLQRHANVADLAKVPFSDKLPSVPTAGLPGSVGVAFTQYYTPPEPGSSTRRKQYGVVGNSFMGVFEFGKDFVRARTLLQYGANSNPASPNFFDQASLLSQGKFKESPFNWKDVVAQATRSYPPGGENGN